MTHKEVLDEVNVIYERLSNPKDIENGCYSFSDGNYTEALEILIDYYEVGFIEELEKIKQEIQSIIALADSRGEGTKLAYQCQIVINERISELKGEQDNE